ncbi:hypothetical protein [Nonomuraea rhodomycinica]|uniref:Amidophosphoribosyltransferase n=1 Tax=Nonomuraea rhodomycinica TaxID=1712872 RepID=A0A7Y6IQG1_9ACTN|nr:hypothetical protein [Nonomuraea rhodomycinica]NUW42532.1 hypothetical protein [Nonomuraea rhodomycinica]
MRPGVCRICHSGPNEITNRTQEEEKFFPECLGCRLVAEELPFGVTALTEIVPLSLACKEDDQLYAAVTTYDEPCPPPNSVDWVSVLAAVVDRFCRAHARCLSRLAGGDFTLVTTLPRPVLGRPDVKARDRVRRIATKVPILRDLYSPVLEPGPAAGGMSEMTAQQDGFTATSPLRGQRVLLLDDLWVRGGYVQSAALALYRQEAATVVPLVIARRISPPYNAANTLIRDEASNGGFSFERCCLC